MSRHRKHDPVSSSDTLDAIRSACESCSTSEQAINRIRGLCDNFDDSRDSRTSPTTIDAIREICHSCDAHPDRERVSNAVRRIHGICDHDHGRSHDYSPEHHRPCDRFDQGNSVFQSIITPVTNLTPQFSGMTGTVQFLMRRKNKTVTLQWEPFVGTMAASGVAFLTVAQSISNLPPYPINRPITIQYKGIQKTTNLTIDPHATNGNIRFFLNNDASSTGINIGDAFFIPASSVEWIVF